MTNATAATIPATTNSTKAAARWLGLDLARLVASWAIIWIHVPHSSGLAETTLLCRFAVPFFTLTAVYFVFTKVGVDGQGSFWSYARLRFKRLYLPFLAWSMFYLAFKFVKHLALPEQENDFGGWEMLWTGSAYHLWFLPFILVASLVVHAIATVAARGAWLREGVAWGTAIVGLGYALLPPLGPFNFDGTSRCVWFALPSVCWGMTLAAKYPSLRGDRLIGARTGLSVFVVASLGLTVTGRLSLLENLAGFGFSLWALTGSPSVRLTSIARLGTRAYGIYCSHLVFIKVSESIVAKLRWPESPILDLTIFSIAVAASTSCAWLLSFSRRTRWLVA